MLQGHTSLPLLQLSGHLPAACIKKLGRKAARQKKAEQAAPANPSGSASKQHLHQKRNKVLLLLLLLYLVQELTWKLLLLLLHLLQELL